MALKKISWKRFLKNWGNRNYIPHFKNSRNKSSKEKKPNLQNVNQKTFSQVFYGGWSVMGRDRNELISLPFPPSPFFTPRALAASFARFSPHPRLEKGRLGTSALMKPRRYRKWKWSRHFVSLIASLTTPLLTCYDSFLNENSCSA